MPNLAPAMIILSIGNSNIHLQQISKQLNENGFKATWTNFPETVATLFNGSDLDMVTFGRGINAKTRLFIKKIFSVQNPAIVFVDGLAPIPNLLVDQVKHTAIITSGRNGHPIKNIEVKKKTASIDFTATKECQVKIKLYHISPLYTATEKVLAVKNFTPGNHSVSINPKDKFFFGKHFIVVKANDKPLYIERLA